MPPPIPEHQKRFTANPTRPARYRPGKAVPEDRSSDEDEDEEEAEQVKPPRQGPRTTQPRAVAPRSQSAVAQDDVDDDDDDDEGFVTDDEDDVLGGVTIPPTASSKHTTRDVVSRSIPQPQKDQPIAKHEEEQEDEGEETGDGGGSSSEEDSDSESEEDSSAEEDVPQRKFQRPTFIRKTDRQVQSFSHPDSASVSQTTPAPEGSSSLHDDQVAARRLAEAENMIKLTIERDTLARLAGKKAWDDDEDVAPEALVDDTDGLDPEAEHSAWRLRELNRLKRDRETMVAKEKELEEIERRRNLTAEERDAEDKEYLAKQNDDREEGRGKAGFLTQYHHKGAFFMDDSDSKRLAQRDLIGAKFVDDVDKSVLPEYMRIRDMTKLGKKGRTRYTDLKGQDTGQFGNEVKRWRGSGYNDRDGPRDDVRGLDERFLPDDGRDRHGGPSASGANASAVGVRRENTRTEDHSVDGRGPRGDREGDNKRRPSSRSRSRSQNKRRRRRRSSARSSSSRRSISKSPPHASRRRRSPSPYLDRDKRRRLEA